ncbi:TetR/AcrR family transcriptional regulator [Psychroflexus halocasei]|uniref:DNA-binding transcriptional regulator, AcrR family n=1 Tax=Psychroflexus halocasei TaxID=908615 RepID=A0A1H4ALQ2_9FLAO|nr:TetR/AcrR family transcriptional regulator [Psychroflexus halocasei]SEA36727.1 DNA-binding transcriptional regulator, AcrR family [Psychroflexus halocasei]
MNKSRHQEIINTAAHLFKEKGYNAVSMRDLASKLDIKAASLYNHISSKQEILAAIVLEVAQEFTYHINTIFPEKSSTQEKLEAIIQNHIEITLRMTDKLACMNNDWVHLQAENKEKYRHLRNAYEDKFRAILKEGKEKGEIKDVDLEIIVFSFLATLRTLYLWYTKKTSVEVEILQRDLPKTLLDGIIS